MVSSASARTRTRTPCTDNPPPTFRKVAGFHWAAWKIGLRTPTNWLISPSPHAKISTFVPANGASAVISASDCSVVNFLGARNLANSSSDSVARIWSCTNSARACSASSAATLAAWSASAVRALAAATFRSLYTAALRSKRISNQTPAPIRRVPTELISLVSTMRFHQFQIPQRSTARPIKTNQPPIWAMPRYLAYASSSFLGIFVRTRKLLRAQQIAAAILFFTAGKPRLART